MVGGYVALSVSPSRLSLSPDAVCASQTFMSLLGKRERLRRHGPNNVILILSNMNSAVFQKLLND